MRTAGGKWMVGVAVAAMAVLGCASDDAPADVAAPSTSVTSISTTTTTTTIVSTTTSSSVQEDESPTFRATGPSGSGCTPGGDTLPDGWWFGERTTPIGSDVGFDLACYYADAAADAEAAARDDVAVGGFYIVNDNPQVRTVPVSPTATAQCLSIDGVLGGCDVDQVNEGFRSIWIEVRDGVVVRVIEQLLP
ncbi:hypothetical protein [Actinospongicola halichondriae]|uniref:hypothetical protein n=1 Tax=Actinospongicola halichondriae TaxID=3236844 RepID=UPI003D54E9DD